MISSRQHGAGMIEVLITIIISAVGLLGLASIQMLNIKQVNNTEQRTLATMLAYDLAERVRSNQGAGLAAYQASQDVGRANCSSSCSVSDMANADLYAWQQLIAQSGLKEAEGRVSLGASDELDIKISWKEQDRFDTSETTVDGVATKSFTLKMKL